MNPTPRSLHTLLNQLSDLTDYDTRFLIACSINLYMESRRRTESRALLVPEDIGPLFSMVQTCLTVLDNEPAPDDTRPRELTDEETASVVMALDKGVRRA